MTLFQAFGQFAGQAAAAAATTGLTFITRQTATSASSLSMNNIFSATYNNYLLLWTISGASTSIGTVYRMRVGGSDNSTASSYVYQRLIGDASTVSTSVVAADAGRLTSHGSANNNHGYAYFYLPFLTQPTAFHSTSYDTTSTRRMRLHGGHHNQSVSYDGLTIYPVSGTFTITVDAYGFEVTP